MNRYWWVNHKATFRHEIGGGYLWSPQREKLNRSTSYDNMRRIQPGDLVISYANQLNSYIGTATDYAIASPKPEDFGQIGQYWANLGWYVPIKWMNLSKPVRYRDFWDLFSKRLPAKFSPIVLKTGRGNQKVYLAEISGDLFRLIIERSGTDKVKFEVAEGEGQDSLAHIALVEGAIEKNISQDKNLDSTIIHQMIDARRGQGAFRAAVQRICPYCRVTGLTKSQFLVASHIKPWRSCSTAFERLDGYNGLLLAPQIDMLFDRGFISFENNGNVLLSDHLHEEILFSLGCQSLKAKDIGPFAPEYWPYLAYHREHHYIGTT